jgi:DNA-binding transcriptional ArsR family regulator
VDAALRALADETRRRFYRWFGNRNALAGKIAPNFSITRPAISQHLTVLLESNLISVRQEGTRRLYHANRDVIEHLRAELDAFWGGRIGKLKTAAERVQKQKRKKS